MRRYRSEQWETIVIENLNKVVLITGATGSVGENLVAGFSKKSYQVIFHYNQSKSRANALAEEFGAMPMHGDLSQPINLAVEEVDILINNAAINDTSELTGDLSLEDWNRTIALNLTAPFLLIKQCIPHMLRQKWGRIVNISSIYGLRGAETCLPYTVSKHGLSGLTKTVAREYGPHGITCNEICPGPIESRLLDRVSKKRAGERGIGIEEYMCEVREDLPTGQLVLPSSITRMALLLASENSGSINGSSVVIDGGMIA